MAITEEKPITMSEVAALAGDSEKGEAIKKFIEIDESQFIIPSKSSRMIDIPVKTLENAIRLAADQHA